VCFSVRQACSRLLAPLPIPAAPPFLAQERSRRRRPLRTWNHFFCAALARFSFLSSTPAALPSSFCPSAFSQVLLPEDTCLYSQPAQPISLLPRHRSRHRCRAPAGRSLCRNSSPIAFRSPTTTLVYQHRASRIAHCTSHIAHRTSHAIAPLPWPAHRTRHLLATHPIRSLARLHLRPTCP